MCSDVCLCANVHVHVYFADLCTRVCKAKVDVLMGSSTHQRIPENLSKQEQRPLSQNDF